MMTSEQRDELALWMAAVLQLWAELDERDEKALPFRWLIYGISEAHPQTMVWVSADPYDVEMIGHKKRPSEWKGIEP